MNIKKFRNYQDTIMFVFQIILLETIILFIKLISVDWNWQAIEWSSFLLMVAVTLYAKFVGTQYATKRNLLNQDVTTRETQIKDLFVQLLNSGKITKFEKLLFYNGELQKIQLAINKENTKNQKLQSKKLHELSKGKKDNKALDFKIEVGKQKTATLLKLLNLLKENKFEEYEEYKISDEVVDKVDIAKIKYKYLTTSDLFGNHKKSNRKNLTDYDKVHFNQFTSSLSYNMPFYVITLIMSYILSCFNGITEKDTTQAIIDALSLTMNVCNGIFTGFLNGGKVINEDYRSVLDERIKVITETYNKMQQIKLAD